MFKINVPNPISTILEILDRDDQLHEEEMERIYRLEAIVTAIPKDLLHPSVQQALSHIRQEHREVDREGKI